MWIILGLCHHMCGNHYLMQLLLDSKARPMLKTILTLVTIKAMIRKTVTLYSCYTRRAALQKECANSRALSDPATLYDRRRPQMLGVSPSLPEAASSQVCPPFYFCMAFFTLTSHHQPAPQDTPPSQRVHSSRMRKTL
jgi:hypothetical protein